MNIKGLTINGLNLIDKSILTNPINIPFSVKYHKYGAIATWSHCTDTYKPTVVGRGIDAEINALKYNLQMTVFAHHVFTDGMKTELKDFYNSGRTGIGSYEYTGKVYADGVITDETYLQYIENQYNWVRDNFGLYPSIGSYGYGYETFKEQLRPYYLGVRNSGQFVTEYGYDIVDTGSIYSTTRQADMVGERTAVLSECANALNNSIINNGWYRDFTHWHNCTDTMLEDYFRTQRETIGSSKVITLDMGTAVEYMKFRQTTQSIDFFEYGNKIYIRADVDSDLVLTRNIKTTLSVQVDLSNSILANKELKSNYGVQKTSTNNYIIEIPYKGFAVLEQDIVGKYLDFGLPTINSVNKVGNIVSVVTDKPTNIVLFKVPSGLELFNATIIKRDNNMSTKHDIDVTGIDLQNQDIYIGTITKEKQSILSSKYSF